MYENELTCLAKIICNLGVVVNLLVCKSADQNVCIAISFGEDHGGLSQGPRFTSSKRTVDDERPRRHTTLQHEIQDLILVFVQPRRPTNGNPDFQLYMQYEMQYSATGI